MVCSPAGSRQSRSLRVSSAHMRSNRNRLRLRKRPSRAAASGAWKTLPDKVDGVSFRRRRRGAGRHKGKVLDVPGRSRAARPVTPKRCRSSTTRRRSATKSLLDAFWHNIDPTQRDAQFCDHGTQYRSAIFYARRRPEALAGSVEGRARQAKAVQGRDRHRDHAGVDLLSKPREYPPGLLHEEPGALQGLQDGLRTRSAAAGVMGSGSLGQALFR